MSKILIWHCGYRGSEYVPPKYATLAYWFTWNKVPWEASGLIRTLSDLPLSPWKQKINLTWESCLSYTRKVEVSLSPDQGNLRPRRPHKPCFFLTILLSLPQIPVLSILHKFILSVRCKCSLLWSLLRVSYCCGTPVCTHIVKSVFLLLIFTFIMGDGISAENLQGERGNYFFLPYRVYEL